MKKPLSLLLALALLASALPVLAAADGYPADILLPNGIPYGNYGYQGLIVLHGGDMAKVDAHMRSARANQQGAGTGRRATAQADAAALDLVAQLLKLLRSRIRGEASEPDIVELRRIENALSQATGHDRQFRNQLISAGLSKAQESSVSALTNHQIINMFFVK